MQRIWNFWRTQTVDENPTFSERELLFIDLCRDGLTLTKWKEAAQKLMESAVKLNSGEVQLLLDALSQDPHPDRTAALLLILEKVMREDPSHHYLLASPSSVSTILDIMESDDKSNIYQLGEVLLQLQDTPSLQTIKVFVPVLLDRVRRNVDLEEGRTPLFHDALILLRSWVCFEECWIGIEENECLGLFTDVLVLYPYDLDALHIVFLFLQRKQLQLQYTNQSVFHLVVRVFLKTTSQRSAMVENSQLVAWLSAGIMCLLARATKSILEDVVRNHLPVISTLRPVVEEEHGPETPLQVIDSIMMMLIEASRRYPSMMRDSADVLWKMKMESPWAIKTTIRKVLVNIGEAVHRQISLRDCNEEHMKKILFEHGVRQQCIDRLTLTGEQFLDVLPETLTELMNLNKQESEMVERIQNVYNTMVRITGRQHCARISHEEMERYLTTHFAYHKNQSAIKPVRSLQSLDNHYYFYALMDVAHILDNLTGLQEEP